MNERGEIMTNTNEIGRIIRKFYQQLYANKLKLCSKFGHLIKLCLSGAPGWHSG